MAFVHIELHSTTPQPLKIQKVVEALKSGAVMLYPTDTGFALGCCLSDKAAITRVRRIRKLPEHKNLTFLCASLTNIAEYARVSNHAYRTLKRLIPGPFTFILPATKAVPHFAVDAKRKTTGIRVPDNLLTQAILREHGSPIISITAKHPDRMDEDFTLFNNADEATVQDFIDLMEPLVDVVVTSDRYSFEGESSVIDMTDEEFVLIRRGAGIKSVLQEIPELDD